MEQCVLILLIVSFATLVQTLSTLRRRVVAATYWRLPMQQLPTRLGRVGLAGSQPSTPLLDNLAVAGGFPAPDAAPPPRSSLDALRARKFEGAGR